MYVLKCLCESKIKTGLLYTVLLSWSKTVQQKVKSSRFTGLWHSLFLNWLTWLNRWLACLGRWFVFEQLQLDPVGFVDCWEGRSHFVEDVLVGALHIACFSSPACSARYLLNFVFLKHIQMTVAVLFLNIHEHNLSNIKIEAHSNGISGH